MSDQITKQITDEQFCDEIIQLTLGTHWAKGNLETHCWVPVTGTPPEGVEVKSMWRIETKYYDDDETEVEYSHCRPDRNDYGSMLEKIDVKQEVCFYKSQWCLVGMVMKIGGLHVEGASEDVLLSEKSNESYQQMCRIINRLAEALPEGASDKPPWEATEQYADLMDDDFYEDSEEKERYIGERKKYYEFSRDVVMVEVWNDKEKRTRDDIVVLVTAARDRTGRIEEKN